MKDRKGKLSARLRRCRGRANLSGHRLRPFNCTVIKDARSRLGMVMRCSILFYTNNTT